MDSLKKQGLGSDTVCPSVHVTPDPVAFPPTGEFWPVLTWGSAVKATRFPHVLWISMGNYRTELFCRQNSIFVHSRGSHQLARQQTLISKLTTACSLSYPEKKGESGGNTGRRWKVLWWLSAGNRKAELTAWEREREEEIWNVILKCYYKIQIHRNQASLIPLLSESIAKWAY